MRPAGSMKKEASLRRQRLDLLLVERGLAGSRQSAQALILAGAVRVNGQPAAKAGRPASASDVIEVRDAARFVGRGGEKLEHAMSFFRIEVRGLVCLDVGASTGGFTDCLLQRGALRVIAVDVGRGQMHWRLRRDPRVLLIERCNARNLKPGDLPEQPSFAAVDVSFISLSKILPALHSVLRTPAEIVTLIKPQFEAGREHICRGGVVRDEAVRSAVVAEARAFGETRLGWEWRGVCESPLLGPAGNVEFLAYWRKREPSA